MNLVAFSLRTKGPRSFARRLWTVFARFGFSEARTRQALHTMVSALRAHNAAPTFFIPAAVLHRHPALIAEIAQHGAEIGIHGYFHNDYRSLSERDQYKQTAQAITVFRRTEIPYRGFRNPYLGWTESSLDVFSSLGFGYESNEAVLHDVIDVESIPSSLRDGFERSLALFQAIPCSAYTLRPHVEGDLLRIPTSIPDDEMLFDRLRITDPEQLGRIWTRVMRRVYELGGVYTLNMHPERGTLAKRALEMLLAGASSQPLPVWVTPLEEIARWWQEREQFHITFTPLEPGRWRIETICSPRATLLARHVAVEEQPTTKWFGQDLQVLAHSCVVSAPTLPCIGLSRRTPAQVGELLREHGYPSRLAEEHDTTRYAFYVDMPEGLGATRTERIARCSALLRRIEEVQAPLIHFGCWPDGNRAALAITGDIDAVTVQDFFLRILEVR
jgi:peptidoglycan/xylan/chitin deacetylase (PgdA/CDA1 family)